MPKLAANKLPRIIDWYENRGYAAEDHVFSKRYPQDKHHAIALQDAQEIVSRYLPDWKVKHKGGNGHYGATCYHHNKTITLGRYSPLWLVLHELAHAMCPPREGHGNRWRSQYVGLVYYEMSPWWSRRLAAAFKKVGYR